MNREELAHILRAAARIAKDGEIIVIGSQAILGTYDSADLPPEATRSIEADVAFRHDPEHRKSDDVDGLIGEDSQFHETHGYYGQGVSVDTAVLPSGWQDRVVMYDRADADPSRAVCVDAHDLVVSKLVAGRQKDVEYATALLARGLISAHVLLARAELLPGPRGVARRVAAQIERCARSAGASADDGTSERGRKPTGRPEQ